MSAPGYAVSHLDEIERRGPFAGTWHYPVRSHFGIASFGIGGYVADEAGVAVIEEHDETGPLAGGHEELYLVVRGHATFTVGGQETDAPARTLVFVPDPATRRTAVAREPGTTVLAIGAVAGQAFEPAPWESIAGFWTPYSTGDYDGAIAVLEQGLERYRDNAGMLFNLACAESLAGRSDASLQHLSRAIELGDERMLDMARTDEDFAPLRADPRFQELVG